MKFLPFLLCIKRSNKSSIDKSLVKWNASGNLFSNSLKIFLENRSRNLEMRVTPVHMTSELFSKPKVESSSIDDNLK